MALLTDFEIKEALQQGKEVARRGWCRKEKLARALMVVEGTLITRLKTQLPLFELNDLYADDWEVFKT